MKQMSDLERLKTLKRTRLSDRILSRSMEARKLRSEYRRVSASVQATLAGAFVILHDSFHHVNVALIRFELLSAKTSTGLNLWGLSIYS